MTIDKNLSSIFDVSPIDVEPKGELVSYESKPTSHDEKIDDDYENTRNNLYSLLKQGNEALQHALEVAKTSEHPRAFEVVGGLMKQLSDINHQLVDLHTKKADLVAKEKGPQDQNTNKTANVTNNAIFVGSTAELSKMISNMRKGD